MDIQFKIDDKQRGSFYIENKDGQQIAELDFDVKDGVLNAYHTGVRKELEGQGIAGKLFDRMVDYAQSNSLKVLPSCSYILVKFKRDEEKYSNIWQRDEDEPTGEACGIRPKK